MNAFEIKKIISKKLVPGPIFTLEYGLGYVSAVLWFDGHSWSKSVTWKHDYLEKINRPLYDLILESDVFTPYFKD